MDWEAVRGASVHSSMTMEGTETSEGSLAMSFKMYGGTLVTENSADSCDQIVSWESVESDGSSVVLSSSSSIIDKIGAHATLGELVYNGGVLRLLTTQGLGKVMDTGSVAGGIVDFCGTYKIQGIGSPRQTRPPF